MSKASTTLLERLHSAAAAELLRRIEDGEASAADIGAAIKMLKDNNITAVIEDNTDMASLQKKIDERRAKRAPTATPAAFSGPLTSSELDTAVSEFHVSH